MKLRIKRALRIDPQTDQRIAEYRNDAWANNARQLLQIGLTLHQADGIIQYQQLAYGERIALLTHSQRAAELLASKLQTNEPIPLPTGDYLILLEV